MAEAIPTQGRSDGSKISDDKSPTGYVQSPVSDLSIVADAGQKTGQTYRSLLENPETSPGAKFNVGLYCQQAGLSLQETYFISGAYAMVFSSNAKPDAPYSLNDENREFTERGFKAGQSGMFGEK